MTKTLIIALFLSSFTLTTVNAQEDNTKFQIEFENFDSSSLTTSEKELLDLLIKQEVSSLKKEIEQLQADYKFGRISKTDFEFQKAKRSKDVALKMSKYVNLITESKEFSEEIEKEKEKSSEERKSITFWEVLRHNNDSTTVQFELNTGTDSTDIAEYTDYQNVYFGFGFANWMDSDFNRYNHPESRLEQSKSLYFHFSLINAHYFNPKTKKISFDYGLTLMSKYQQFKNADFSIYSDHNGINTIANAIITESTFIQSSLEIPLDFSVRFGKKNYGNLVLSAGVYGGLNFRTKHKIKYSIDNQEYKTKIISDFDTQTFYAGGKLKIGYKWFLLEGRYNFTELFNNSVPINVNPYTIGLGIKL